MEKQIRVENLPEVLPVPQALDDSMTVEEQVSYMAVYCYVRDLEVTEWAERYDVLGTDRRWCLSHTELRKQAADCRTIAAIYAGMGDKISAACDRRATEEELIELYQSGLEMLAYEEE